MYIDARKITLIQEMLKVSSEVTLDKIETVLKKSRPIKTSKVVSAYDFAGTVSKKDTQLIEKAIAEGCEQISQDDWR